MRRLVPPEVQRMVHRGADRFDAVGAALILDAEGSTALATRLQPYGTAGAEVFAEILSTIFTPVVERVIARGGAVAEFGGDGILAVFCGDPETAVARALLTSGEIFAAMGDVARFDTPDGPASVVVRSVVGAGSIEWMVWKSHDVEGGQNAAYACLGTAIDEARRGERLTPGGVTSVGPFAAEYLPGDAIGTPLGEGFVSVESGIEAALTADIDQPESSEAPADHVRFHPEALGEDESRAEFRDVVTVFVELGDFGNGRTSGVEELLAALSRRRGFLDQIIKPSPDGDRLRALALWGAPTSREHDVGNAIRFLDDLQAGVASGNIRAGVTRSTVFAGFIGTSTQGVYTAIGPGVSLAARICDATDWGEIRVDETVSTYLTHPWRFAAPETTEYKGFSDPITTMRVDYVPPVRVSEPLHGEFVGRQGELDQLEDLLAPLWADRSAGVIAIAGEPGIGKSRLLSALETRLLDRRPPPVWVRAQADEIRAQPLATLRDALAGYFGRPGRGETGRRLDEYIERLSADSPEMADELARTRSALGDLLGLSHEVAMAEQLDPRTRFDNLVVAVEKLITAIGRSAPVIVAVSDGQWIDSGTAEVLRRLVTDLTGQRVAVVVETRSPTGLLAANHQVEVGPLGRTQMADLAEQVLGETPDPDLVTALVERSGGNPFFALQLLEFLQRTGQLGDGNRALELFGGGDEVPLDMRRVLVARLDDLQPRVRRLVQTASVLGREVDIDVLREMAGANDFERNVQSGADSGIWERTGDSILTFRDLLIRDAAYGMLLHADARSLHARAAAAIESSPAADSRIAELAYHHDRAGHDTIAADYYLDAGRLAADRYENREALALLDRALELTAADDTIRRYRAHRARHDIYELEGERASQEEALEAMSQLAAGDSQRSLEVALLRGRLLFALGRYVDAEDALRVVAPETEDPTMKHERASHTFLRAQLARNQGRIEEARSLAADARRFFEQTGDQLGIATVDDFAGGIAWERGEFEAAANLHRSAARIFARAGSVAGETAALNNLGTAIFSMGDYSAARQIHLEGAERSREIGYRMREGDHLDNIGGTAWAVGDLDLAMRYYTEALQVRLGIGDAWGVAISKGNLGATRRALGHPDEGLALYREALEIDRRIGRRRGEAYDLHGIGLCHLDLGRYNLATEALRQSAEIREELQEPHLANESNVACAVAMLRRGDTESAAELAERVLTAEGDDFFAGAVETTASRLHAIEVLAAIAPETAQALQQRARDDMIHRANRIGDPEQRRSYLDGIEAKFQAISP